MTSVQIAACFRKALDTAFVRENPDVRTGVILASQYVAAGCIETEDEFSPGCFFQLCEEN